MGQRASRSETATSGSVPPRHILRPRGQPDLTNDESMNYDKSLKTSNQLRVEEARFVSRETDVACKRCGSDAQRELDGELSASLPNLKGLHLPPLYVSQHVLVCLDCGFTEVNLPASELEQLKRALAMPGASGRG
jgi:hypothetical protein